MSIDKAQALAPFLRAAQRIAAQPKAYLDRIAMIGSLADPADLTKAHFANLVEAFVGGRSVHQPSADRAQEMRLNIAALSDEKLLEMREVFCAMANVEQLVNRKTTGDDANILGLEEIQKLGSDWLAKMDGLQ